PWLETDRLDRISYYRNRRKPGVSRPLGTNKHERLTTNLKALATTAMLALALVLVPACSGRKTKPNGTSYGETMGPAEGYGRADDGTPGVPYGPEPMQVRAVTLVLGPGMARGLASVGALRALVEAKIPIAAIYGAEMGSLVAALYAADSNINHFEWALLK